MGVAPEKFWPSRYS
ncbi:hypothetical protein LEC80_10295 [Salmonella enterica]|nr:hypothetical protein [Salmonella enterica]MDJ4219653.1 hypothetical protein [Salmonella enterica]MDJ5013957.1 hypothetical protein [Salmonella enterica]MDJ7111514.1 hypothetical protein [Salmonella enterica]MDJ8565444.1 hypothetical protein [Salmonella enterica]MEA7661507.1 hypothetical protein [Salmonella enterica subsp. enterica serovar Altona]